MRTRPLPPDLGTAFHVREADVLGIPRRRLAADDLRAPFHGVRVAREESLESVAERCQAYLPRITGGQFFSHTTAATLWGMPLPFRHGTNSTSARFRPLANLALAASWDIGWNSPRTASP